MVNSMIMNSQKTTSTSILYIIIPLLLGVIIDILFSQIMGSQYCSLNKFEYVCSMHGFHMQQWQREVLRVSLQFGLILCAYILIENLNYSLIVPIYSSIFGLTGLILFFVVQSDLFSDFRRFFNGLVFSIKHN